MDAWLSKKPGNKIKPVAKKGGEDGAFPKIKVKDTAKPVGASWSKQGVEAATSLRRGTFLLDIAQDMADDLLVILHAYRSGEAALG